MTPTIIAIVGSRLKSWREAGLIEEGRAAVNRIVALDACHGELIISGDSPGGGVDLWAREAAEWYERRFEGHPPSLYTAQGIKFAAACAMRDRDIAKRCDELYAVFPGEFPTIGTAKTIGYMERLGKRDRVHRVPVRK